MVRFSPMAIVACLLCAGIFAFSFSSPQQSRLTADDVAQKKAEIRQADTLVRDLTTALKEQQTLNAQLSQADDRTLIMVETLQASIERISKHLQESVPSREEVTRLVTTNMQQAESSSDASSDDTCEQKLADLQRQIDELKTKVAALECTPSRTSAAAASSYGTVSSSPAIVSSGGSTGSVSYGSTGSTVVQSYGSTGSSPVVSSPVVSSPVIRSGYVQSYPMQSYSPQPVIVQSSSPVVVTSDDGCYYDAAGNKICPNKARAQILPRLRRIGN